MGIEELATLSQKLINDTTETNVLPSLASPVLFILLFSLAYTDPDNYFINSGAKLYNDQVFVADRNSASFSTGKSKHVSNTSTWIPELYQTARNGTYIVRLHFFAYLSRRANLYDALFNVSASALSLLTNFSIRNSSGSPVTKEFLLTIPQGDFRIQFIPSQNSSLAFVNAIEVFLANETRITDNVTRVTSAGNAGNYKSLLSQALHTIHRINFGESQINYDESNYGQTRPNYNSSLATNYTASDYVYQTAKKLKEVSGNNASLLNLTWRFPVSKNTSHFVRVHFCDIVFKTLNDTMFNLYICSNFVQLIDPYNITGDFAVPSYIDYVNGSPILNAFLNGLEIMEFMKKSGSILDECKPVKKLSPVIKIFGFVCSGAFMILIMVVALRLKCRKSFNRLTEGSANSSLPSNLNLSWRISLAEIQLATKNFDAKLLIGEGGFGKVYKGTLHNGTRVAVKRSEAGHGQGIEEFQTEVMVLSQIRHQHLVSLIGYCDEGSEMILVYEYMEKGTLREHLYHSNDNSESSPSRSELSWKQRLEICIGAATGLRYLHTGPAGGIIHRDVKTTNILLNENYVAKVADFGLSKSGISDLEHYTMGVKGSFGYLDPEYLTTLQLTEKSDVYSFGVVLIEILCARPAINNSLPMDEMNLAEWGMLWQRKGQLEKIIDPVLVGRIKPSSLRKFGETAEKCLKTSSADRPEMHEVLYDLQYALKLQETAIHADPREDSTINTSFELHLPLVWQLPSDRILMDEDDHTPIRGDDDSDTN
ncbi:hypothetical protein ACB094_02G156400 [Castanea mollissima]